MIKIEITKCLCGYGYTPYFAKGIDRQIKRGYYKFPTLKGLKAYYSIDKVKNTGRKEWAISSTGKKYEFPVYEAEIADSYSHNTQ